MDFILLLYSFIQFNINYRFEHTETKESILYSFFLEQILHIFLSVREIERSKLVVFGKENMFELIE